MSNILHKTSKTLNIEEKYLPGVQLAVLVVHQEEGGAVSIDQLLCLAHHLQDQGVHADHLLEYRPDVTDYSLSELHLILT